ncbi:hypothetical protein HDA32_002152 [Spinactinospora alkalitolerans]|uniref:Uncharacterized protein n=1 Tax=Spinactinospora alkalitolerans TaxID=687207 RepID=A0A852TVZ6_9ACTN|nr:hypothetical protein [Spinactinospora alkalitolerans]NYE47032.1 hypothetical protein [Spinactinospora alkalitolerans]
MRALGAAHVLRGSLEALNPDAVRLADRLRAELGEHAYRAAYRQGRDLDRAGALTLVAAQLGTEAA